MKTEAFIVLTNKKVILIESWRTQNVVSFINIISKDIY